MAILYGLRFFWRRQVAFISLFSPWEGKENAVMVGIFFSFVSQRNGQEWGGKGAREAPDSSASRIQHGAARQLGAWQSLFAKRNALFCITDFETRKNLFFLQHKKNNAKQNIFYGSFSDTLFSSIPSAQQESLSAQNSFFLVPSVFRTSSQTFLTFLFVSNWHTAVATNNSLDSLLLTVIDITIKLKLLYNVGERKMKETNGDRMRSEFVSFISLFVRVERRGKCAISFRR